MPRALCWVSTGDASDRLRNADSIHILHDTRLTKKSFELVWTITEGLNRSLEVPEICFAEKLYHERPQACHDMSLVSTAGFDVVFVEGDIPNPVFGMVHKSPVAGHEHLDNLR